MGLAHGGADLEKFELVHVRQILSVVLQITIGLTVAEAALNFEHRDTHLSNVLVMATDAEEIRFKCENIRYAVATHGVHATLIDCTLSRIDTGQGEVYKNLSDDPALFTGSVKDPQSEVYRAMKRATNDDWKTFCPKTNVIWVEYVVSSLVKMYKKKLASATELADVAAKTKILQMKKALSKAQSLRELAPDFFEESRI
ncbi:uncharacterized protein LOC129599006 [Paramacrobiotus metropolitanus]|uniref:uncharacterized protein LOC129599006 n=1 Tax=Paramacrobiotus metropolitanus TaxID=2943436 RepID=UPI002445E6AC|nr:uncharacterized protein LOC129599006 [Paramacrobiotus metropolitanus]